MSFRQLVLCLLLAVFGGTLPARAADRPPRQVEPEKPKGKRYR